MFVENLCCKRKDCKACPNIAYSDPPNEIIITNFKEQSAYCCFTTDSTEQRRWAFECFVE